MSAASPLRIAVFCGVLLGCASASAVVLGLGRLAPDEDGSADEQFREPVVWEREYAGEVHFPDPSNWMVGYRLTGESCVISLRPGPGRDLWVRSSFWEEEKLARIDGLRGRDFYLGELPDNQVFILQTDEGKKPVSVGITGYDDRGRLIVGPDYGPKDRIKLPDPRECVISLKRPQRRTSQ